MSKPVHGDPQVDKNALIITEAIRRRINEKFCRNLDLKTIKSLIKVMKTSLALLEDAQTTKIQQSLGGLRGSLKAGPVDQLLNSQDLLGNS